MSVNVPSAVSWIPSLVLGLLSLVAYFVAIPFVSANAFWVMGAAWLVLILAMFLKGK